MGIIKYLEINNYNYYILKLVGCDIHKGKKEERRKINMISIQLKNLEPEQERKPKESRT